MPLRWRRLYALAVYLYLRPGELAALEWGDVDLAHGFVNVHQALDREAGEVKSTKTGVTRKVPIHPHLAPLLEVLRKEAKGKGRVVQNDHDNKKADDGMPPTEDLAATLRDHLKRAKVERAELYADRSTTKRITFYDLRATGITWEVLAGTEHVRVQQRAGHKHFSTTQGYIREAETLGVAVGEPFPALPSSMIGSAEGPSGGPTGGPGNHDPAEIKRETQRPQGDSNGCATRGTSYRSGRRRRIGGWASVA